MILPDTSVWVDFSRRGDRGRAAALRGLLDAGEVSTCGPVAAELLAGAAGDVAERFWETLHSLPWAELPPAAWRDVGVVAGSLRRRGSSLPLTDVVIAIAAVRAGHVLWTFDGDFARVREALPELELREAH